MYQNAAALNAYEQWQNNVGHNLANVSTTGFKKQGIALHNDPGGKMPMEKSNNPFERMLLGAFPEASDATSFDQGALRSTGNPTDLAIEGEGFFELQLPEGGTMLTRGGHFQLNADGQLVTPQGYPVLSAAGTPIVLDLQTDVDKNEVYINGSGEVFRGNDAVGVIGVTFVEDTKTLRHREGGFVISGETETRPAEAGEYKIQQGFLEGSNTSAMREMVQMVNLSRAFESSTRIVQAFDSRYGQTISQLGTT